MKFILENAAIIVFVCCYQLFKMNISQATLAMIITAVSAMSLNYFLTKQRPSTITCVSTALLTIMGALTILSGDSRFIKMKPTIVNSFFGFVLLAGYFKQVGLLKYLLSSAIQLQEQSWLGLSFRFGIYFILIAILNEFIWRNFSEQFWVDFKIWGMLPINIVFMLLQVPYILRNRITTTVE